MKAIYHTIFIPLLMISVNCFGQDFYFGYNRDTSEIRRLKIVERKESTTEFSNNKKLSCDLTSVEQYNSQGLITKAIELYSEIDTSDIMTFSYNHKNQLTSILWRWFNSSLELKKITFEHDEEGKLTRECNYFINENQEFELEDCHSYQYANGKISVILQANGDTVSYFKSENEILTEFKPDKSITAEYDLVNQRRKALYSNKVYEYFDTPNDMGILTIITDLNNNRIGLVKIEYQGKLPLKITSYDQDGSIKYQSEYEYIVRN
ncbi:MAG: hypothetical protein AAFQ94_24820 [Bacteroidota bacterium]